MIFEYVVAHLTVPLEIARNPGEARPHLKIVADPAHECHIPSEALFAADLQALKAPSLLRTCRRAYAEVKSMLYATMTVVSDDPAVTLFLGAASPPSHFLGMRVCIHRWGIYPPNRSHKLGAYGRQKRYWREIWKAIAGLQVARVTVYFTSDIRFSDREHWSEHAEGAFGVIDEVGPGEFKSLKVLVDWPEQSPPSTGQPWREGTRRVMMQREGAWRRDLERSPSLSS